MVLSALFTTTPAAAQSVRIDVPVSELEARAQRDSCDAAALYNLAVGQLSQNRFDLADSTLQRAVALDPQFAVAYFAMALVQDRNDRFWDRLRRSGGDSAVVREARRRLAFERKAFLLDPFVDVRLMGSVWKRGWVSLGATSAFEQMIQGNYPRAYEEFDRVLRYVTDRNGLDSISSGLLWLHALAAARTEHYPEAIADGEALLRQSLAHEHDDSTHTLPLRTNEYRYMLAALHQRAAHRNDAVRLYQEVVSNDLGNYMAHVQLARIYEAERNRPEAIRERQAALDANPEDHTLVYDLGATLARAGQWQQAEETLRQALQMQPRDARTSYTLGIVCQQLGKAEEARAAFTQFLALAPSRYSAQVNDARQRLAQLP